jgi:ATP-binding cassette subfamily B protein
MGFGRDIRAGIFDRTLSFSRPRGESVPCPVPNHPHTNDVQQVQMLVLMTGAIMVSAPMMMIGVVIMALREDAGLSWLIVVAVVLLGSGGRRPRVQDDPALPGKPAQDRKP